MYDKLEKETSDLVRYSVKFLVSPLNQILWTFPKKKNSMKKRKCNITPHESTPLFPITNVAIFSIITNFFITLIVQKFQVQEQQQQFQLS